MDLNQRDEELNQKLKVTDLPKAVDILIKDARKRKRQVFLLTVSIALDILLTIGLTFGYHQNHSLAVKAESNHQAIIRSCETGNEARANNKQLWTYILDLPSTEPITPERQESIDNFKAFLDKTFAPRDCSNL